MTGLSVGIEYTDTAAHIVTALLTAHGWPAATLGLDAAGVYLVPEMNGLPAASVRLDALLDRASVDVVTQALAAPLPPVINHTYTLTVPVSDPKPDQPPDTITWDCWFNPLEWLSWRMLARRRRDVDSLAALVDAGVLSLAAAHFLDTVLHLNLNILVTGSPYPAALRLMTALALQQPAHGEPLSLVVIDGQGELELHWHRVLHVTRPAFADARAILAYTQTVPFVRLVFSSLADVAPDDLRTRTTHPWLGYLPAFHEFSPQTYMQRATPDAAALDSEAAPRLHHTPILGSIWIELQAGSQPSAAGQGVIRAIRFLQRGPEAPMYPAIFARDDAGQLVDQGYRVSLPDNLLEPARAELVPDLLRQSPYFMPASREQTAAPRPPRTADLPQPRVPLIDQTPYVVEQIDPNSQPALTKRVVDRIRYELAADVRDLHSAALRGAVEEFFVMVLADEGILLSRNARQELFDAVMTEIMGLGFLEPYLAGKAEGTLLMQGRRDLHDWDDAGNARALPYLEGFRDEHHLLTLLHRLVAPETPLDWGIFLRDLLWRKPAHNRGTPHGHAVHFLMPPATLAPFTLVITKVSYTPRTVEEYIRLGSLTGEAAEFLRACVIAQIPTLVTSPDLRLARDIANLISGFIPNDERLITYESGPAQLQLRQEHVVILASAYGDAAAQQYVQTHPDWFARIVHDLCADRVIIHPFEPEYIDDWLAGTFTDRFIMTLPAAGPYDALQRLLAWTRELFPALSEAQVRQWVFADPMLLIHVSDAAARFQVIVAETSFVLEQNHNIPNYMFRHDPLTGANRLPTRRPGFIDRIENSGIHLPPSVFGVR
ncbi:MAG: hypothetical protein JXA10_15925 [Anaerolineae bacterium]|nr:hypothetical protein [Anaerolineae bacterium]